MLIRLLTACWEGLTALALIIGFLFWLVGVNVAERFLGIPPRLPEGKH